MNDLIPVAVALPDRTPAPAVVVIHGQGSRKEDWLGELSLYSAAGIIGIGVDARRHGGRAGPTIDPSRTIPQSDLNSIIEGTATDIGEVVDSLSAMPGWDGRVAVWGFAMGAAIALLAAVRDNRIGAAALVGLPLVDSRPRVEAQSGGGVSPDGTELLAARALAEGIGGRRLLFVHGSLDEDYRQVCRLFEAMADTGVPTTMLAYHGERQPPAEVLDTVRDWTVGALVR